MSGKGAGAPRTVIVVGAGIVGLSTAWFLQKHGVGVTVVERDTVASGSSWGNAGWIAPGLAIPLNEPGVLGNGLKALFDPKAPLSVPPTTDTGLLRFLASFALHSGQASWERALRGNVPLSSACLDAFEELAEGGVAARVEPSPITALFTAHKHAARLVMELDAAREAGLPLTYTALEGEAARAEVPIASEAVRAGVRIDGQRHVNPGVYTHALADSVRERGGSVVEGFRVTGVEARGGGFRLRSAHGETESADAVVVATGAWLGRQARPWGVDVPLRPGRGYSFMVPTARPVPGPVYLPEVRVACTPHGEGLRVAGTMEFRDVDAPLRTERIRAITESAEPCLAGADLRRRTDEWVGSRPVTSDGLPLVGPTRVPGLYVAGGHGMWGLTHGPVTGRLLARTVATGVPSPVLRPFDPLR
ncbi:D-amino-acid dehydrogenase [Nocardiopsis terrae]|uniref:D-amino-acid dehydrogenase n=1 Tax=Nocardiopsis terrae TaxID=372655 RepID=A0ABR9HAN5_9ACTN|nr:FAD-dependent oxidoreductase [Nocardiopsis terrae]MBE1456078.1 D-amino-acid dehydrogenase [Nocardiopsis terrae]GHC95993.1 D-amino-acid dehydrogenase [Nocardiopsis terrae]